KPNRELIHYCLENPPYELGWKDKFIHDAEGNPTTATHQPEWQRFVTLIKQSQELKHVSYHKLYDILKQHQHEVNEIRAEKIARKIYKPTNNNLRTSSNPSRGNQDNSPRIHRNAGYEGQRSGTVAGARDTVGSSMVQKSGIQCYNCKEYGHEEAGIQLNAEQADWRDDTDDQE
nr:hypothetical protein [Tanacetum cinerariifolium]